MKPFTCDGVIVTHWYYANLGSARLLSVQDKVRGKGYLWCEPKTTLKSFVHNKSDTSNKVA